MSGAAEMIADIVAEKRELAAKIRAELSQVPARREDELLEAESLEREADRIEAAWKRERVAVEADALSVGGFVEAARHRPGNAAAMREALLKVKERIVNATTRQDWSTEDAHCVCNIIESALSAPPRNCDLGTAEEQTDRFRLFCKMDYISHDCPDNCPLYSRDCATIRCSFAWAQMPYVTKAERKGESDGR